MHKILLLIRVLPPKISGSVIVVENLARQFSPSEMIIAGGADSSLDSSMENNTWQQQFVISTNIKNYKFLRIWRYIEIPFVLIRAINLIKHQKCTDIITVFPDETYLLIGYLAAKITKKNFYPYFHNLYLENKHKFRLLFADWLQPAVFRGAKCVFAMSEGMAEYLKEQYPNINCLTLPHCINLPIPASISSSPLHSPLTFVMSGSISESCLDAAVRMSQAISQISGAILKILTPTPISYLRSVGMVFDDKNVLMPLSSHSYLEQIKEADIILLPHGLIGERTPEEYQTIFPTRLIEYLFAGLPILAHTPQGSYLTKFLLENQCAIVVDSPSIAELLLAIDKLRKSQELRIELVNNAAITARQFSAENVSTYLRQVVSK